MGSGERQDSRDSPSEAVSASEISQPAALPIERAGATERASAPASVVRPVSAPAPALSAAGVGVSAAAGARAAELAQVPAFTAVPQTIVPVTMNLAELTPALDAAGIELAQTDPAKLAAVQARIATEEVTRPLGRERPPRAKVEEVPLVQVQTRH